MNEFKIRAYGRMELAQLYSPELTDIAAYRKMKKWISLCPGLLQRLYDLGYESKRRFRFHETSCCYINAKNALFPEAP